MISNRRTLIVACLLPVLAFSSPSYGERNSSARVRQPVELLFHKGRLLVLNRGSGSLTVVDPDSLRVTNETILGGDLRAMTPLDGRLLVSDAEREQVRCFELVDAEVIEATPLKVSATPVAMVTLDGHQLSCVSCLWSQQIAFLGVDAQTGAIKLDDTVEVPVKPHCLWVSPDERWLVVADSFWGALAIVDVDARKVVGHYTLDGHNIRGLALSPDGQELVISQQLLNGLVPTVRERITWGAVVSSVIRFVPLDDLLRATPEKTNWSKPTAISRWSMTPLGETGRGAADPGPMVLTSKKTFAVLLSGVHKLAVRDSADLAFRHLNVGLGPVAIVADPNQPRAFVANRFGDSLSVVDLEKLRVIETVALGPSPEFDTVSRGEQLFYDARLSHDGWFSCHSCHTDGHTNDLASDNLSDGSYGAPKRIPSLFGSAITGPWGWMGQHETLAQQIRLSIQNTMNGPKNGSKEKNVKAIAAYLASLTAIPETKLTKPDSLLKGAKVFKQVGCIDCHLGDTFYSKRSYNVRLTDELGNDRFNPPSLRGIAHRRRFLHDNRASTLVEAIRLHQPEKVQQLTESQREDLIQYLRSL